MLTGYEEKPIHVEESDESFEKLLDGMYSIGVAEDWQEEIEVEPERDEETDADVQD